MSNVELNEALRGPVGDEAARMIAEVVPPARELATRHDLTDVETRLKLEITELRAEMREGFARIEAKFGELKSQIYGRMLTMFVPLWLGVFGVILTLLLKS